MSPQSEPSDETTPAEMDYALAPSEHGSAKRVPPGSALVNADGVTGGGYSTLSLALAGNLAIRALLVLCVFKLIATVFSYASGGAGGIFAPTLFIGGMLGGVSAIWTALHKSLDRSLLCATSVSSVSLWLMNSE